MRQSGELVQWNDDRGFGFVRDAEGRRYFVHITDIRRGEARPRAGDRVMFVPSAGADGRPAAKAVVMSGAVPTQRAAAVRPAPRRDAGPRPDAIIRIFAAAAIVGVAGVSTQLLVLAPSWLLVAYLVLGIVSMGLYWHDKTAAENERWRIAEKHLHFCDLVGGIAGGLVAQAVLRHKVRKPGFAAITWSITLLHLALLAAIMLGFWAIPAWLW